MLNPFTEKESELRALADITNGGEYKELVEFLKAHMDIGSSCVTGKILREYVSDKETKIISKALESDNFPFVVCTDAGKDVLLKAMGTLNSNLRAIQDKYLSVTTDVFED